MLMKPGTIATALFALVFGLPVSAQQPVAEELPVPEENSVLVDPTPKPATTLEAPRLAAPAAPRLNENREPQQPALDQLLPPPLPFDENAPVISPRLAAPSAPNLGSPVGEIQTERPRVFREGGPVQVLIERQLERQFERQPARIVVNAAPVRVKDAEKRFPGAVPTTVEVHAPHNAKRGAIQFASPQYVEVWVPPFPPKEVKHNRDGSEVDLDFGEYEVEVHWRRDGRIEVDYDD